MSWLPTSETIKSKIFVMIFILFLQCLKRPLLCFYSMFLNITKYTKKWVNIKCVNCLVKRDLLWNMGLLKTFAHLYIYGCLKMIICMRLINLIQHFLNYLFNRIGFWNLVSIPWTNHIIMLKLICNAENEIKWFRI